MFKKPTIIFWLLCCLFYKMEAQSLQYSILLKDENIGNLQVKRFLQPGRCEYLLESNIQVDKIIAMNIHYRISSTFEKGKLIKSNATQTSNGKTNVNTSTTWDGQQYNVITTNGRSRLKDKLIDFDLGTLYYNEPIGRKRIWSNSFGKWVNVRDLGKHRYEITLPDEKKNFYSYNSGICYMVETEQLFSKVTFLLKTP